MKDGFRKKPDGHCVLCRRRAFTKGGLQLKGWNHGYKHRLAKLHLYRFHHRNSGMVLRVCVICVHDLLGKGEIGRPLSEDRGGVGGELGSPTRKGVRE